MLNIFWAPATRGKLVLLCWSDTKILSLTGHSKCRWLLQAQQCDHRIDLPATIWPQKCLVKSLSPKKQRYKVWLILQGLMFPYHWINSLHTTCNTSATLPVKRIFARRVRWESVPCNVCLLLTGVIICKGGIQNGKISAENWKKLKRKFFFPKLLRDMAKA